MHEIVVADEKSVIVTYTIVGVPNFENVVVDDTEENLTIPIPLYRVDNECEFIDLDNEEFSMLCFNRKTGNMELTLKREFRDTLDEDIVRYLYKLDNMIIQDNETGKIYDVKVTGVIGYEID